MQFISAAKIMGELVPFRWLFSEVDKMEGEATFDITELNLIWKIK